MAGNWQCNICKTAFYSSNSAWEHYKAEHIQFKYICTICTEEFRELRSFEMHWLREHKISAYCNKRYLERKIELVK